MGGYSEVIGVIEIQPSNTTPFEVIVACIIVSVLLTIGVTVVSIQSCLDLFTDNFHLLFQFRIGWQNSCVNATIFLTL